MSGEAARFAAAYSAVRAGERWAEADRRRRASVIADAIRLMREELGPDALIVDIGSGTTRTPGVIAMDLVPGADVRADMLALPLRDGSAGGALYAASLHYAPIDDAVAEASRILRPRGLLAAIDSPIYAGRSATAAAVSRSAAYYARAGHPELASHYHPIELEALRRSLAASGFEVVRLSTGSRWRRLLRRGPSSFVLARKLR